METLSKEEAATVGLNHVKKNDITENDIRKDQGLNPRGAYKFKNKSLDGIYPSNGYYKDK